MAEVIALARVVMWGETVGAVAEDADGAVTFEYDDDFRRSGREISPLHLPLSNAGPMRFPELARSDAFQGLPGVLADSLPDRFGNAVIRHYFEKRGEIGRALSPVQRLLYIGRRAMGALEFEPSIALPEREAERLPLEIADLVKQSRSVVQGRTEVAIPEIMVVGASAGGMRPKALILWNLTTNEVRSGHAQVRDGDESWLIKFDGVRPLGADIQAVGTSNEAPQPYMRIEYAYSLMARAAGLTLPDTHLLLDRGYAHFMVRRFDRMGNARVHQHTLGGMLHSDYNIPGEVSYEEYLRVVLRLELGYDALEEAFRRAVFNIVAVNQDDHIKNLSFLMDGTGRWALSPAYDVTYARGHGWTKTHQMSLRGKREGITREDLAAVGREFGLKHAADVIERASLAVSRWEEFAAVAGVPSEWTARVRADMTTCGV